MDHLNVFNPYKNKSNNHEDELTRSFLILLKNIPIVQVMFFEMVRNELPECKIDSIANGDLGVEEVYTQLSNSNNIFTSSAVEGRTLLSIIISDDKLDQEVKVQNDDRQARYDGVILCNPSWLFIVENKPSRENIWLGQLNPNVSEETDINIIDKPCCLSWRGVISGLNSLIQNNMVTGLERVLIENFIEYVDNEYSWINPYTTFGVCKSNLYLLNKRCILVMANCKLPGISSEVKYHRGWKYYIESGRNTVKQIALDANQVASDWTIDLWMYAGDTMNSARETFEKLDINKLFELQTQGFEISKNFHISYRSSNLLWFDGSLTIEEYLRFWKREYKTLKQVKRADFSTLFDTLEQNQIIVTEDRSMIQEKILTKNYDKLNICPGFLVKYTWPSQTAISLDKSNNFEADFRDKVKAVFGAFGGI
ncbi:hypothetical protein A7K50_01355 [Dehalobacter sp. MCB1]|uniref:hypothetical protein n=1 Tax=unclassified Dehalobacter TaxID=2635733 RepID=UPI000E6CD130|nr:MULTISPECIES: hypothetical protein [unclassified Dehalobacter]RJE47918.1 hypothetical protein A7K50_01355 [Dehalobacter sp. MCB1]TCX56095.1 hypothetical protein C1I38_00835 [Dehalobacter sp. 12DCB1]